MPMVRKRKRVVMENGLLISLMLLKSRLALIWQKNQVDSAPVSHCDVDSSFRTDRAKTGRTWHPVGVNLYLTTLRLGRPFGGGCGGSSSGALACLLPDCSEVVGSGSKNIP